MALHHVLFTGVTQSGKTTAARAYAREFCRRKQPVVVYDPTAMTSTIGGDWGESARVFSDRDEFLAFVTSDKMYPCHLFIDEADEIFSLRQPENFWLLKKGRHFGIFCYVITQRPKMVAPTVRNQCVEAYVFRLSADDMKMIGNDFALDLTRYQLQQGDYLRIMAASPKIERGNIFDDLQPSRGKPK